MSALCQSRHYAPQQKAPYSITPSAVAMSICGTVRLSLAVSALARPFAAPPKNKSQVERRFRVRWRFRFLHLAFWLRLSFARDALVHL